MFSRRSLLLGCLTIGLSLATLTGHAHAQDGKLSIVATTGMIADTVRAVAGDRANVEALMGSGVDPHLYKQTRADVIKLSKADIIVYNGHYLEAQLEDLLKQLASQQTVIAFAETIPAHRLLANADYRDKLDPHVWMDPELWAIAVGVLKDRLAQADPAGKAIYEANATAFLDQIEKISAYAKEALGSVPAEGRVLITPHDAFNYFGRAYGFEVMGIQGISTESEAGLKRVEQLVEVLTGRKIGAIFVESSVSDRNVRALIEGAAAQGHTVKIGGELFSDAMGPEGTYEGTYIGMIDHNVTLITRSLGGSAPERGLNGKLGGGA